MIDEGASLSSKRCSSYDPKGAVRRVFSAARQRCRVHWMRNALSYVPKAVGKG